VLRARVITALVLAGGMTVTVLYLPTWAVAWVIGLFCLGGVWEWAGLTRLHGFARWGYLSAFALLMLAMARWGLDRGWTANTIMAVAVCWWGLAALALRISPRRIPLYLVGATGPLALFPAWFLLTHLHGNAVQGPSLTLSIMFIVWAADVGGHFVGGNWGRVKLAPRVSPAKTWEGVIGGVALATLFALSAGLLLDLPAGTFVAIGIAAALVSVVGDLTVSMLKRNVSVKDSGSLLPGHGGILDRIDGLVAAAPIFFLGLVAAGLTG